MKKVTFATTNKVKYAYKLQQQPVIGFTKTMAAIDEETFTRYRNHIEKNSHFEQFGKFYSEL